MKINRNIRVGIITVSFLLSKIIASQAQDVSIQNNGKTTSVKAEGNKVSISTNEGSKTGRPVRITTGQPSGGKGGSITVIQNRKQLRYTLNGESLTVSGNNNDIHVQGKCGQLSVNGNGNVIHLESVGSITALGNKNQVLWRSGAPSVSNPGSGNVISRQ